MYPSPEELITSTLDPSPHPSSGPKAGRVPQNYVWDSWSTYEVLYKWIYEPENSPSVSKSE
ncbi:hypothetical protein CVS40_3128 [Lucilia cuprina]|nr:hypothetical protein CVS40_3128 [Lucilia cuprina]